MCTVQCAKFSVHNLVSLASMQIHTSEVTEVTPVQPQQPGCMKRSKARVTIGGQCVILLNYPLNKKKI